MPTWMLKIFPDYLSTHMTSPDEVLLHVLLCFLVPPQLPVPVFAPALPRGLVAVADNLLGTANVDLLLLPLPMPKNGNRLWWTCSNPCRHSCDHVSLRKLSFHLHALASQRQMTFTPARDFACPNSLKLWRATLFVATCARLLLCNLGTMRPPQGGASGQVWLFCNVAIEMLLSISYSCIARVRVRFAVWLC
jgi:hypothetical protein